VQTAETKRKNWKGKKVKAQKAQKPSFDSLLASILLPLTSSGLL